MPETAPRNSTPHTPVAPAPLIVIDAGSVPYANALAMQIEHRDEVLAARESGCAIGRLILLEHNPPVITVSRRPSAIQHLLASPDLLARQGVEVCETDRGGDITYHGPGQLVAYPILDLNTLGLNLHAYLRFLEQIVIDLCASLDLAAHRDKSATGVWVGGDPDATGDSCAGPVGGAKICAIGVRVRRWVTTHGLALNVTTNLDHFGLIVPCGLTGRPVTSLQRELGDLCPTMPEIKAHMADGFRAAIDARLGPADAPT